MKTRMDPREHTQAKMQFRTLLEYITKLQTERDELAYEVDKQLAVVNDLIDEIHELTQQISSIRSEGQNAAE